MNPLFLPPATPAAPVLTEAMKAHIEATRPLVAQRAKLEPLFRRGEAGLPYRLYVPQGEKLPLVLFLHGKGECGTDNCAQLLQSDGAMVWVRRQQENPAFACCVLAPQCPEGTDCWTEPQLRAVDAILTHVLYSYPVDPNRIYLVGKSVGATGAIRLSDLYPARFAGLLLCACLLAQEEAVFEAAAEALQGQNLWLFHSEDDPVAPVTIPRRLAAALEARGRKMGKHFFYTEYPAKYGLGHRCWDMALESELAARWLFAQDRSLPPMPENPGKPDVIPPEMQALAEQMARDRKAREAWLPRFRELVQESAGIRLRSRFFAPEAAPDQRYPLVVFLHGVGECGSDNTAPLLASAGGLIWVKAQDQGGLEPCFVLVPQCPLPIPGLRWEPEYLRLVGQTLDALEEQWPIDRNRIYVTGLSLGGYGVWNLIKMFPRRFAAAVTCCPACVKGTLLESTIDQEGLHSCAQVLRDIPLWLFHAQDDPAVSVAVTEQMAALLEGKPDLRVTIYPAEAHYGHACWIPAYGDGEMRRWLFAQRL